MAEDLEKTIGFAPIRTRYFPELTMDDPISYLLNLPQEVQLNILSQLSTPSLRNLCSSNLYFSRLCEDSGLWSQKIQYDFPYASHGIRNLRHEYETNYRHSQISDSPNRETYQQQRWKILSALYNNRLTYDDFPKLFEFAGKPIPYDTTFVSLLDNASTINPEIIDQFLNSFNR